MADENDNTGSGKRGPSKRDVTESTKAFQDQLNVITQLRQAISGMSEELAKYCEMSSKCFSTADWQRVTNESAAHDKQTRSTTQSTADLTKKMKDFGKSAVSTAPAVGALTGALKGLKQGFTNLFAISKGIFNFFGSIVKGAFSVTKAIIAIPFGMLKGMSDMALEGQDMANQLFEAMEGLRKEFGFLGPTSAAVKSTAMSMKGFNDTGLSAFRVFGNAAERIKYMTQLASEMGPQFAANAAEFQKNGGALLAYQKGLGLTGDQMAAVAAAGMRMGKDMGTVLNEVTKQSIRLGKEFGLDAKVISKDMGKALKDMSHFGHLSTKEIATSVVYANKLGISLDKITGLMDQFDTFDKAAESTSKLNEQFGTNIDAMELMAAQSPAEKFELLRKSFAATGKDLTQLNFHERKFLQTTAGLTDEAMNTMIANQDQGDKLHDVASAAKKAEDAQLSQADAMKQLAIQIERLNNDVKAGPGGFMGNLMAGFSRGVKGSAEFQGVMMNLRESMRIAGETGARLGTMFVKAFPGVKQMLGGLSDLFNPARFQKLSGDFMKVFGKYFDPKTGEFKGKFEDLLEELKKVFGDFFDSGKPASRKIFDGFKKFGEMFGKIFSGLVNFIVPKLAEAINKIADWISKPKFPVVGAKKEWFQPFLDAFATIKDQLGPALSKLGTAIWEKLKESLLGTKVGKGIIAGAIAVVLGPALLQGIAGAAAGGSFKKAGGMLGGLLGKGAQSKSSIDEISKSAGTGLATKAAESTKSPAGFAAGALPSTEDLSKMEAASTSKIDWSSLTKFIAGFAAFFYIGIKMFGKALEIVKGVDTADVLKAGIVLIALSKSIEMFMPALAAMEKIKDVGWKTLGITLLAIAGLMIIGLGAFFLSLKIVKGQSSKDLFAAMAVLYGLIPVFIGLGFVVAEIAVVGALIEAAKEGFFIGMIALGDVIAAMIVTAAIIGGITRLIGKESMLAGAAVMLAMSQAFAIAGVVIGEAAAIGVAILSTGGIGGAAIAVGMGAIVGAVGVMMGAAVSIMAYLESMTGNPDQLKKRAEAFASVMNAVTNLTEKIGDILETISGFMGIFSSEADNVKMMDSLGNFIQELLNGKDGKGGINGIIKNLIEGMKVLTPDKIETTKAFSGLITSVGTLLGSVGNALSDFMSKSTSLTEDIFGQDASKTTRNMQAGAELIESLMGGASFLVSSITASLKNLKSEDVAVMKDAGAAVGSVLSAVAAMMQALVPDPQKFMNERTAEAEALWGMYKAKGVVKEIDKEAIKAVTTHMTSMLDVMTTHLPPLIYMITSAIGASVRNLTPEQVKSLEPMGKILSAVFGLATAIAKPGGQPLPKVETHGMGNVTTTINVNFPTVREVLQSLREELPLLLRTITEVATKMSKIANIDKSIDILTKAIEILPKIVDLSKSIAAVEIPESGAGGKGNDILAPLADLTYVLNGLINPFFGSGGKTIFDAIVDTFNKLSSYEDLPGSISFIGKTFSAFGAVVKTFLTDMKEIVDLEVKDLRDDLPDWNAAIALIIQNSKESLVFFSSLTEATAKIGESLSRAESIDPAKTLTGMQKLNSFWTSKEFQQMSTILAQESIPTLATNFEAINLDQIKNIAKTLKAVEDMVAATQKLDDALATMPKINLQARLTQVAGLAGLGTSGIYTVKSKDVVVQLDLKIVMEADKVEKVIVERSDSLLRRTINDTITDVQSNSKSGTTTAQKIRSDFG